MSIVTLRSSAPTNYAPVLAENPDADFERRWTAWIARGLAHDAVIRQRSIALGIVVGRDCSCRGHRVRPDLYVMVRRVEGSALRGVRLLRDGAAVVCCSNSAIRFKAFALSAAASRAIDGSAARSNIGTRRSSAATNSRSSRTSQAGFHRHWRPPYGCFRDRETFHISPQLVHRQ